MRDRPIAWALAFFVAVLPAAAQFAGVPGDPRLVRLQQWLAAVERHQPGTRDEAARTVRLWDRRAVAAIREDMLSIGALVQNPGAGIALPPEPGAPATSRGYTRNQIAGLRIVAEAIRRRGNITDLLKRGALLHTDIAFIAPPAGEPVTTPFTPALQRTTLYLDDGRQQGLDQSVGHLEMSRRLLDLVRLNPPRDDRPNPERDAMVRRWYQATGAVLIDRGILDLSHFERALQLFPEDAAVLFMAGALRERLAGPRVQDGVRNARLPSGLVYRLESERAELRRAEALFRRSLDADPTDVEARIRLGRVRALLGRPADAARELRAAAAGAMEPLLQYYAALFLGRAADAIGSRDEARASYERAAALYPRAQSPHLALSELAMRRGDRAAALAALDAVWTLPPDEAERQDPLWAYYHAAGRHGDGLLAEVNAMFPAGPVDTR